MVHRTNRPPGIVPDFNVTIYNPNSQTITNAAPISMPEVQLNSEFTMQDGGLLVPAAGTYLVSFSINNSPQASTGDFVAIALNGNIVACSKRPITSSTNVSCTLTILLNRNEVLTLVTNVTTAHTINAESAPSATLAATILAY